MQKRAFTLTELLIALGIIGAIAAVSIPSLMSNINNRVLASQLKNTVVGIQQIIDEQLTRNNTTSLSDTDFGKGPSYVLVGVNESGVANAKDSTNFSVSKICPAGTAYANCWKITTDATPYKWLTGADLRMNDSLTIKLKSGALISYFSTTSAPFTYEGTIDKVIGAFDIDVNGNEGPNIAGRDFYSFYITDKGKIVDNYYNSENVLLSTKQTACQKGSAYACFGAVVDDGWRINY